MEIEIKNHGHILCLKPLKTSINATTSATFKLKVNKFIAQGNKHLLLNLSEVDFIDSSGLGALISILKCVANNKGKIVFCEVQTPVQNLFNLTRLNRIIPLYLNEKEAIKSLEECIRDA